MPTTTLRAPTPDFKDLVMALQVVIFGLKPVRNNKTLPWIEPAQMKGGLK